MSEEKDTVSLLHNPLSEVTRKERRMLLIVSLAGIAITKAGLIPSQIRALGINFASSDQRSLYFLVSAIVIYFIIAFFIYSISDILVFQKMFYKERRQRIKEYVKGQRLFTFKQKNIEKEVDEKMGFDPGTNITKFLIDRVSAPTILSRAFFEFALPIGVGIYSAYLLISTSLALSTTAQ